MKEVAQKTSVNVIYFTTACNFACTYCYEQLNGKAVRRLTKDEIKKNIDEILENEPEDQQTLFVMFGGEVFLEWENAKFFMDYAYNKKKNVHFNFETNGYKFRSEQFIDDFKNTLQYKAGVVSVDVSFDGLGNSQRVLRNGKQTTPFMLDIFKKLHKHNLPFRLRYTIHKENVRVFDKDIRNIAKFIKPKRIITSIAYATLSKDDIDFIESAKTEIHNDFKRGTIDIPICEMCCETCKGCSKSKQFKSYYTKDGNINKLLISENSPVFKDF